MAAFVEFIGVPGAGKSTVYREVAARWRHEDTWLPVEILLEAKPVLGSGVLGAVEKRFRSLSGRRLGIDRAELRLASRRFVAEHPRFATATWSAISSSFPAARDDLQGEVRFELATFWFDLCGRIQLIQEREDCRICVMDEGLLHNNFLASPQRPTEVAEATTSVPAKPVAVVHCVAPADVVWARQLHRGRIPPTFRGVALEDMPLTLNRSKQRAILICAHLVATGIPVLEIDSEDSPGDNARRVLTFLDAVDAQRK